MTEPIVIDRQLARDLLANEARRNGGNRSDRSPQAASSADDAIERGERVLQRMQQHLTRWFGPDGVDALIMRALDRTRPSHPVLARVERRAPGSMRLNGIAETLDASRQSGAEPEAHEVTEGIVALIATILALIGRLVGDDMARHLVRQIWPEELGDESLSNEGSNNERSGK